MNKMATQPKSLPSNSALVQLDPVNLGGVNYYGWKIVFTKSVDTGKKDKHGNEQYGQKIDDLKAPIYDSITSLLKAGKLNNPAIADLAVGNAQNTKMIATLMKQVADLKKQLKGDNK